MSLNRNQSNINKNTLIQITITQFIFIIFKIILLINITKIISHNDKSTLFEETSNKVSHFFSI